MLVWMRLLATEGGSVVWWTWPIPWWGWGLVVGSYVGFAAVGHHMRGKADQGVELSRMPILRELGTIFGLGIVTGFIVFVIEFGVLSWLLLFFISMLVGLVFFRSSDQIDPFAVANFERRFWRSVKAELEQFLEDGDTSGQDPDRPLPDPWAELAQRYEAERIEKFPEDHLAAEKSRYSSSNAWWRRKIERALAPLMTERKREAELARIERNMGWR